MLALFLMIALAACVRTGQVRQPEQAPIATPMPTESLATLEPSPDTAEFSEGPPTSAAMTDPAPTANGCLPVPDPGPDAHVIETVELNKIATGRTATGRTAAYLAACLEGAWRQLIPLAEHGLLHPVTIGVIDSGLYEPLDDHIEPGPEPTANKILKNEFDWDKITIHDMHPSRGPETTSERKSRIVHGAGVASIIAAVNHGGDDKLPQGLSVESSFSGVVTSVPGIDYKVHFYEVGKKTATSNPITDFKAILKSLDDIIERQDEIDVVNISLAGQCGLPNWGCYLNPIEFFNQTREYDEHFRKAPEVIFVVGAGNAGVDARLATPAILSTSSIPSPGLMLGFFLPGLIPAYAAVSALHSPNVITVGAFDYPTSNRWLDNGHSSNYGPAITIAAPGAGVWAVKVSRIVGGTLGYKADDGTSYAAPFITGVVALLRSIDPDIPAQEVIEILVNTSIKQVICTVNDPDLDVRDCPIGNTEVWRVLNADAAIRELLRRRGISIQEPPISSTTSEDRKALEAIYNVAGGPNWINQLNWLSDKPIGEWYGVTTDYTGRVIELDLYYVGMTGPLSPAVGDLTNLRRLHLTGNQLSGAIPAGLAHLSGLEWLSLAHNQLNEQIPDDLEQLTSLQNLYLAGNDFSGCLPSGLAKVANNDLDAVDLPVCEATASGLPTGTPFARDPARDINFPHSNAMLNDKPWGIWSDRTTMWVADAAGAKIYAYNLSTKERDAGKDFDTLAAAGNDQPRGIWSDGTTMWVADAAGAKIYAYNLSTKERDPGKDFDTLAAAGNHDPAGIGSDGTTMWVAGWDGAKIYAYNLSTKERDPGKDFDTLFYHRWLSDVNLRELNSLGIWSDGTTMWVTKWVQGAHGTGTGFFLAKIHAYNVATKELDAVIDFDTLFHAGNNIPTGIWSDGTTMWVADSHDAKIYAYNVATKELALGKDIDTLNAGGNAHPTSIWSDGTTMWVADADDAKIYAYNLATKERDAGKDFNTLLSSGGNPPRGIWSDGTDMFVTYWGWLSGNTGDLLDHATTLTFNMATKQPVPNTIDHSQSMYNRYNDHPEGIWSDGTTVWVADSHDAKIYAYNLAPEGSAGKDFDTLAAAGNNSPKDIWSDGTTMWVADTEDAMIYAYNLGTQQRDPNKDINTLVAAGNDHPTGIWSDGTTMWVADQVDRKIYAYNMP